MLCHVTITHQQRCNRLALSFTDNKNMQSSSLTSRNEGRSALYCTSYQCSAAYISEVMNYACKTIPFPVIWRLKVISLCLGPWFIKVILMRKCTVTYKCAGYALQKLLSDSIFFPEFDTSKMFKILKRYKFKPEIKHLKHSKIRV